MQLTVAIITARAEPRLDWLVRDLEDQARPVDAIELVIIDSMDRSADVLVPGLARRASAIRDVAISPPKPNPWQGAHRVTSRDLHGIANARNTALCLASHDYIAFLDDRVRLGRRWLDVVREGERTRFAAICGPCDRDELGTGRAFDDRRDRAVRMRTHCSGDWFYGGNFALPLEWALEINGCEEGTDPVGRQDRVMGCMLVNRGRRIDYIPAMSVLLDRKLKRQGDAGGTYHPFTRANRGGPPPGDKRSAIMRRFARLDRTELTPDLRELRAAIARGEAFPPHGFTTQSPDWYDARPIGET